MPFDDWRMRGSVSYTHEDLDSAPQASNPENSYPEWQFNLRSEWSPTEDIGVAVFVRYVDEIPFFDLVDYWQANVNVRWAPRENWVISLGVRNLLDDTTEEFYSELGDVYPTHIERRAFLNLTFTY